MSLLNSLLDTVVNDTISDQIATTTGLSKEQTQQAMKMLVPVLMGSLAKNAESDTTQAASINEALNKHDGSILSNINISDLLASDDGKKIIGHILGNKTAAVEQTVAKETNASPSQIESLLKIAGPLLMGTLGKQKAEQGLDLEGLTSLLSNEKQAMKSDSTIQSMIFDFIDQNNDGSIIDDVLNIAGKFFGNKDQK